MSSSGPDPAPNRLLEAALAYAAGGRKVFPLRPRDKTPLTRKGVKDASSDPGRIRFWWQRWPEANVAIATGGDLLVIDTDSAEAEAWAVAQGLPETATVTTGKGRHRYYRDASGQARNTAGRLYPGVDTRGLGGYVVAPPSVHPSGACYQWTDGLTLADLADAPSWALATAEPSTDAPSPSTPAPIPLGTRNTTLTRLAGELRADGATRAELTAALLAINADRCRPPERERAVRAIAASIAKKAAAPGGAMVRIAKAVLRRDLSPGALALYATRQALLQLEGRRPRQAALAEALGAGLRTVKRWAAELRHADLADYQRPRGKYLRAPAKLLTDPALTVEAKATALHLLALTGRDGMAAVGQETLAKATGRDVSTVKRHLRALRNGRHITAMVAAFDPTLGRRQRTNRYAVVTAAAPVAVEVARGKGPLVTRSEQRRHTRTAQKGPLVTRESKPCNCAIYSAPLPSPSRSRTQLLPAAARAAKPVVSSGSGLRPATVGTHGGDRGAVPAATHGTGSGVAATGPPGGDSGDGGPEVTEAARVLAALRGLQVVYVATLIQRHGLAAATLALSGKAVA